MDVAAASRSLVYVPHARCASPLPGPEHALVRRLGHLMFGRGLARALCLFAWPERSSAALSRRLRLLLGPPRPGPCLVHDAGSLYLLGSLERVPLGALDREEITILHVLLHSEEFCLVPGSSSRRSLAAGPASVAFCSCLPLLRQVPVAPVAPVAPVLGDAFVIGGAGFRRVLVAVLRAIGFLDVASKVDAAHAGRRALHGPDG